MEISKYLILLLLLSIVAFFIFRHNTSESFIAPDPEGNAYCDSYDPNRSDGRLRFGTCYYRYDANSCKDVGDDSWKKCKTTHGDRNSGQLDSGRYIRKSNGRKEFCEWKPDDDASTESDGSCVTEFSESETDEEPEELPFGCVNPTKYRDYIKDSNALDSPNTHRHDESKCSSSLYDVWCDDPRAIYPAPDDYPNKNSNACDPDDYEEKCKDPNANNGDPNWPGREKNSLCTYDFIEKPLLVIRQFNYQLEIHIPKSGVSVFNEKNGTNYSDSSDGLSTIFNDISAKKYNIVFSGKSYEVDYIKFMPSYIQNTWSNEYIDPLSIDNSSVYLSLTLKEIKNVSAKTDYNIPPGDFYTHDFVFNEMEEIPICVINSNTRFDLNNNPSNENRPITYRIENVNDQITCVKQQWVQLSEKETDANNCVGNKKSGIPTSADQNVSEIESSKYVHDSDNLVVYKLDNNNNSFSCKEKTYIPFGNPSYDNNLNNCPANYTDCNGNFIQEPPKPKVEKVECINTPPDNSNNRWLQMLGQDAV